MSQVVILDSGPLGMVTNPRDSAKSRDCKAWFRARLIAGDRFLVTEITDYEVRQELLRAGKPKGVARLDQLADQVGYLPLDTATMRRAAELWALIRNTGLATAHDQAIDGDCILAAQALQAAEDGSDVGIATDNIGHLARFPGVDAQEWRTVG